MTLGCGHNWDGLRLCELGVSVKGTSAYSELAGVLSRSCTSKNSPGANSFGRSRSMKYKSSMDSRRGLGWDLDPYVWIELLPMCTSL